MAKLFGVTLLFGGALITGVWFAAIGWFLAQTARASYADFEAREAMRWRGGFSAGTRWRYEPKRYEPNWRSLG